MLVVIICKLAAVWFLKPSVPSVDVPNLACRVTTLERGDDLPATSNERSGDECWVTRVTDDSC